MDWLHATAEDAHQILLLLLALLQRHLLRQILRAKAEGYMALS